MIHTVCILMMLKAQCKVFLANYIMNLVKEDVGLMTNTPDNFDAAIFSWNPQKTSKKIELDEFNMTGKAKDGNGFKTTLGNEIFTHGGRYYFEIFINKGQLFKIGVSRPNITNLDQAFSDSINGWAIYNGQTRNGSNSTGPNYGEHLASGDIIGVALDMIEGTLSFYRNEKYWGIAFNNSALKVGQLVAAVAVIYNNDQFTLRNMIKED